MQEIFWIKSTNLPDPRVAIVLRPRGEDWLERELQQLRRGGVETLVSMLEETEAESLGLERESTVARDVGLGYLSYPIPDRTTPADMATFRNFVSGLAGRSQGGESIGIHCRGSIGRATIAAACLLIELGWDPAAALAEIAVARGCTVPDTPEQREWILQYKATS